MLALDTLTISPTTVFPRTTLFHALDLEELSWYGTEEQHMTSETMSNI